MRFRVGFTSLLERKQQLLNPPPSPRRRADLLATKKLERAVQRGDVKELKGALKDLTYFEISDLLILAAQDDQYEVLKLLLSNGADPTHVQSSGRAALDLVLFSNAAPRVMNRLISPLVLTFRAAAEDD